MNSDRDGRMLLIASESLLEGAGNRSMNSD